MIHNDYRSKNIYTNLLIFSFSIIKEFNTNNILIWPNENNLKILNKLCFNPIIYKYNVYFKEFKTNKNKKLFSKDIKIYKNLNFHYLKIKLNLINIYLIKIFHIFNGVILSIVKKTIYSLYFIINK